MEKTNFLNLIQQRNQYCDFKKLSIQSISGNISQKINQNTLNFQTSLIHNQMPAFLNRKIKNLKPYTNHFKRFNIQTNKFPKSPEKKPQIKQTTHTNTNKIKNTKYQFLKELGFPHEIALFDTSKVPQICVYQQFLEKTHTTFSNIIQNFNKTNIKKKPYKNPKQGYPRQIRTTNFLQKQCLSQQRRSLGSQIKQQTTKRTQDTKSQAGKKSSNNFLKSDEVFVKSQKVCIIPHFASIQKQKVNKKACFGNGIQPINSAKYHKKEKNTLIVQSDTRQSQSKVDQNPFSKRSQLKKQQGTLIDKQMHNIDIRIKLSPQKNNFKSITTNFKAQSKKSVSTPVNKNSSKQQRKEIKKVQIPIQIDQNPLPTNITAYSYIVFQPSFSQNSKFKLNQDNLRSTNKIYNNSRILASLNCKTVVQIASLTKIMTFLVSIQICNKFKLDSQTQKVRIGKYQSNINGTSAQINQGQFYTVEQLYHGLMLPSGNDASLALAIWGGKKLLIIQHKQKELQRKKKSSQSSQPKVVLQNQLNQDGCKVGQKNLILKKKKCYERFILQMNKKARALGMTKTTYANSHGLSNNLNKSCAFDLCILCEYAMLNQKFKKVVSTIEYQCEITYQIINQISEQQKVYKSHVKEEEQQNQTNLKIIDDVQHENQHFDEQSIEQMSQKQYNLIGKNNSQIQKLKSDLKQGKQTIIQQIKKQITYSQRLVKWQNTHKLLQKQQYIGIKTGITNTAGPCLASCIKSIQNRYFIIIVLNSKKLNNRFKDTQILRKWLFKKQKLTRSKQSKIANYIEEEKNQQDQNNNNNGQNYLQQNQDDQ